MPETIKLELKIPLVDANMKEIHDGSQMEAKKISELRELYKEKGVEEREQLIYESAPILYVGDALKNIISKLNPETAEEAGDQWVWVKKIRNCMVKSKGEIDADKNDIAELMGLVSKVKKEQQSAVITGQIYRYLKEQEAKLVTKTA